MDKQKQLIDTCDIVHFDIALENCPFCAGSAEFVKRVKGVKYHESISISVRCGNCAASTMPMFANDRAARYPERYKPMFPDAYKPFTELDAAQEAAERWNNRV